MTPNKSPTADDLRPLLKRGLPASGDAIADRLLELPGVIARSAGSDRSGRVEAFNSLLRQLIARMPEPQTSVATAILFGDWTGTISTTLTERREGAAKALSRDPDHFRKHIEPRILTDVAAALAADSARMLTTSAMPPRLIPVLAPPAGLPEDIWAWETVEHEEHISRLWAAVYALRAELLACERLASFSPSGGDLRDAADAALWQLGQLHVAIRAYRRAYGARLLHGDIAPEALIGLAGWTPALDPAEIDVVCHRAPDVEQLRSYLEELTADPAGERVRARWLLAFLTPHHITANGSAPS
jgi:hypothetical protein